jgi:DNA/RNA-binding domain of Phe-tRNA-synthetase-like protein
VSGAVISISPECVQLGLRSGTVVFRNVHIGESSPELRAEIAQEIAEVCSRFAKPDDVRRAPEVVAFRKILEDTGINTRKVQPSVERLLAFVLKRGALPAINNLVDAYNLISIRSLCSMGAHDLDRISLPVSLRLFTGPESFTPLGQDQALPIKAGEFGYVDANERVLCWLDVLQADFSKVTAATVNALLIIEGTPAHAEERLKDTFSAAIEIISRHCGGTAELLTEPEA